MKLIFPARLIRNGLLRFSLAAFGLFTGCQPDHPNRFQGYIEGEYVYVSAPVGGTLTQLAVQRGNHVQSGQRLFTLEAAAEAAAVAQAQHNLDQVQAQRDDLLKGRRPSEIASLQAQLDRAQADLKLATLELARRERLLSSNVISPAEIDQSRARCQADQAAVDQLTADLSTGKLGGREDAVRAADSAVAAAQSGLDHARWSLDQKQQSAPTQAAVHDTLYREGEYVAPGNPVVVLLPPANLKVRFFVPQARLSTLHPGDAVTVQPDGAPKAFPATINFISDQLEYTPPVIYSRETRADLVCMIEATFAAADAAELRPGQPVDVELK